MLVLKGNETIELSAQDFFGIANLYKKIHIDIGTGDGRNIYRLAVNNPETYYIGIDPARDNMLDISKKINKKPSKGGLQNVLLVVAAAEVLPAELKGIADSLSILFPWGTLLEYVIKPSSEILSNISNLAKNGAQFEFVTTYSDLYEEGEIKRRGLPPINVDFFLSEQYKTALLDSGFRIDDVKEYDNEFVKGFNSLWAKRLAYGRKRFFYQIVGQIIKE